MAEPNSDRKGVVLWEKGPVRCTCIALPTDDIEVLLVVDDLPIHRERFTNTDAAATFALDKMRAYGAG